MLLLLLLSCAAVLLFVGPYQPRTMDAAAVFRTFADLLRGAPFCFVVIIMQRWRRARLASVRVAVIPDNVLDLWCRGNEWWVCSAQADKLSELADGVGGGGGGAGSGAGAGAGKKKRKLKTPTDPLRPR
jgi:hypothetical protein